MRIPANRSQVTAASSGAVHARLPASARRVVLMLFDGAQLLDIAGPADVFSMANEFAEGAGLRCRVRVRARWKGRGYERLQGADVGDARTIRRNAAPASSATPA